ncbi:MAG: GNAT family N-acetyltransferase [Candidatus Uhrbacteria bacterium]|nr:GNAT family N-acetyltransferase [Candidatus Uhrbacteria bacterium]
MNRVIVGGAGSLSDLTIEQLAKSWALFNSEHITPSEFAERLRRSNAIVAFIYENAAFLIAGFAIAVRRQSVLSKGDILEVEAVFVEPRVRRLGIGRQVVEAVIGHFSDVRVVKVVGLASGVNLHFYEALGFNHYGIAHWRMNSPSS